eukprot:6073290-Amphidinium_carterae.1
MVLVLGMASLQLHQLRYPLGPGDTFGENLARSEGIHPIARPVVEGWMQSPGLESSRVQRQPQINGVQKRPRRNRVE